MRVILVIGGLAAIVLATPGRASGAGVEVFLNAPSDASPGETFDAPVSIKDGSQDVVSYAFHLSCDSSVLKVVEIAGGTFEAFSAPPVTNPASFDSGEVDFTANNQGFVTTPDSFIAATIRFRVVGAAGQSSTVSLGLTPGGEVAVKKGFRRTRTRFTRARLRVAVK